MTYTVALRPPADDDKPHLRLRVALTTLRRSHRLRRFGVSESGPRTATADFATATGQPDAA